PWLGETWRVSGARRASSTPPAATCQTTHGTNWSNSIMKIPHDFQPRKILIILHGSIGDVTRALPLAGALRRGFPAARIAWSVEPPSLPLLQGSDAIDEILIFDRPRWRRALFDFLAEVRQRKFDLVLDLQRHFKSGLISRWSGAPFRLGFHRDDSKEFNWI